MAANRTSRTPPQHPFTVIRRARDDHGIRQVCIGVSGGKDSVAALALAIEHFGLANVRPFFMYLCPNLTFQQSYLTYIERAFALPRRSSSSLTGCSPGCFETVPSRHPTRRSASTPRLTIRDIENHVRKLTGFDWIVDGSKAIDSLERNAVIRSTNAIDASRSYSWPLAFWNDRQVFNFLKQRSIALSPDYNNPLDASSFGRNLWFRSINYVRSKYPDDWAKIVKQFPLIHAQIARHELRERTVAKAQTQSSGSVEAE